MFQLRQLIQQMISREPGYRVISPVPSSEALLDKEIPDAAALDFVQDRSRTRHFWSILPWCVTAPLGKSDRELPSVTSTSYLNGLRGIACVVVYNAHSLGEYYPNIISSAYGTAPVEEHNHLVTLPIIKVVYAGKAMVCVFFVLSGFVLSYSPLRKIVSGGSSNDLLTSLCSSLIRRGIRLFAPMIGIAIITCFVAYLFPAHVPGNWHPDNRSFFQYILHYTSITIAAMNPLDSHGYMPISFNQCWTLSHEYRGSLVIFLCCVAGSKVTTMTRKLGLVWMAAWSLYWTSWPTFAFLSGMFLAELRYCPLTQDFAFMSHARYISKNTRIVIAALLLVFSLVLCSWPDNSNTAVDVLPYKAFFFATPPWLRGNPLIIFYWSSIGAFFMLLALENLPWLQWLLSTKPLRYLGEISFSFYLLHWLLYTVLGRLIFNYFHQIGCSILISFALQYLLTTVTLVIAADFYWRAIDEKSVQLGKNLVKWLGIMEKSGGSSSVNHNPCNAV